MAQAKVNMSFSRIGICVTGVVLLVAGVVVATGVKQFHIWPQIYWIWCYWQPQSYLCTFVGLTPDNLGADDVGSLTLALHTVRATLVWPLMFVTQDKPQLIDLFFSCWGLFLLFLMSRMLAFVAMASSVSSKKFRPSTNGDRELLCAMILIVLCLIALAMNGRLIMAFFAEAALLYLYSLQPRLRLLTARQWVLMAILFWFSFVSGMTTVIFSLLFLIWLLKSQLGAVKGHKFFVLVLFGIAGLPILLLPFLKLYQQYGYSIGNTLTVIVHHGSGRILLQAGTTIFALSFVLVSALWVYEVIQFIKDECRSFNLLLLYTCFIGGFFGYAAYALMAVPLITMVSSLILRLLWRRQYRVETV